jgi:hypothetical protein
MDSVTTAKIVDANVTTAKLADANITTAKLAYDPNPFRNIIINGDMSIAQRSTSVASITTSGYYTVDRFQTIVSSLGTWTQSQSTDVPTGQGFATSLKIDCTTADASPAAGDIVRLQQGIEGQNLQYLKNGTANAESLTLSFWVKSNKTGTYVIQLLNGAVSRQVGKTYTIDSADTWEKKTITFPGDTSTSLDNDNSAELYVQLALGTGTDRSSGTLSSTWKSFVSADQYAGQTVNLADNTANEWYITGVQLEAGTTASDFEFLPYDVNLQRCLRYYYTYVNGTDQSIGIGVGYNNDLVYVHINYPVEMRAAPSIVTSNNTGDFRSRKANIDPFDTWSGFQTFTKHQSIIYSSAQVSIATGEAVWVETNAATALLAFNSEL